MQSTSPKSERSQTLTAVFFIGLFAAAFQLFATTRERLTTFLCDSQGFAGLSTLEPSLPNGGVVGS